MLQSAVFAHSPMLCFSSSSYNMSVPCLYIIMQHCTGFNDDSIPFYTIQDRPVPDVQPLDIIDTLKPYNTLKLDRCVFLEPSPMNAFFVNSPCKINNTIILSVVILYSFYDNYIGKFLMGVKWTSMSLKTFLWSLYWSLLMPSSRYTSMLLYFISYYELQRNPPLFHPPEMRTPLLSL